MGTYDLQTKDGITLRGIPDGTPDDVIKARIATIRSSSAPAEKESPSTLAVAGNAVAKGVAGIPDMFANAPTNLYNLGKAAVGMGAYALGQKDFGDSIEMSQPPSPAHTGLSKIGLIRPEAEPQTTGQRVLDTAIQGGIGMLASPGSAAANIAKGVVGGTAAGVTKEATGSDLAAIAAGAVVPGAANKAGQYGRDKVAHAITQKEASAVKDATLSDARQAGYVVPPSQVNPSFLNNKLESIAGKAAVQQEASARNQEITNVLANKALGLPDNTALTVGKLEELREQAATPYKEVAKLPSLPENAPAVQSVERGTMARDKGFVMFDQSKAPTSAALLGELRDARHDANMNYRHYERSGDPASHRAGEKAWKRAGEIEAILERTAERAGRPELVDALRESRQRIAKTYEVERSLNVGDGNVAASTIGKSLDKGKPLTGELKTIGSFAEAFPRINREGARNPVAGVSGTDAASGAVLGTVGAATAGPVGLLAAGIPLLRSPARHLALSEFWQNRMTTPNHGAGQVQRMLGKIPDGDAAIQSALLAAIAARQGKE